MDQEPRGRGKLPGPMRSTKHAFAFVWVAVLLDMVGFGLIMPVVPALLRQLTGADTAHAAIDGGWLTFAYAVTQFFCAPIAGALSDAVGRRPVLLLSVLGLGIDYALTALSPTLGWLFLGRFVAGLFGASYTTANAYIADVTPAEDRGKAFGLLGAAFGVGFVVGPAIGGFLGDFGPRVPFFVAAALSLANFVYGAFVLPETHRPENRRPFRLKNVHPLAAFVAVPGGAAVRTLIFACFVIFVGGAVYQSVWTFWATARLGWDPRMIGASLAAYGIVSTIAQATLVGVATKRLGERNAALVGLAISAVHYVFMGLCTQTWMVFAVLILAAPSGIAMPALNAWMSKKTPPDAQGRLQGSIGGAEGLASIGGPLLMARVFGVYGDSVPGAPFFVAAALGLLGLVIAMRVSA